MRSYGRIIGIGVLVIAIIGIGVGLYYFLPLPGLEWVPQYVVVNAFQG